MTITYFPYDAGTGADVTETEWRQFARLFRANGVIPDQLNKFEVYADNSGMQVKVKTGQAWIEGQFVQSDAEETLAIPAADGSNPRKDLVVLRNDFTANTVSLVVIEGTAAASPTAPSPTQSATVWDIPLAVVDVATSESSIESSHVADDRVFSGGTGRDEAAIEQTISGGAIDFIGPAAKLQPESGNTDDLDTINGGEEGDSLKLYASDGGVDTITIKHGTGNILCAGGSDIEVSEGAIFLYHNGTAWLTASGSGGGSGVEVWQDASEAWSYSSVDDPTGVITVPSDAATKYSVGMRIRFTNGGNTIYGIVVAVAATSITFLHEIDPADSLALNLMANSAITAPFYSSAKVPFGFPVDPRKWSVVVTLTTNRTQSSPTAGTWYNISSADKIDVPIGAWLLSNKSSVRGDITGLAIEVRYSLSNDLGPPVAESHSVLTLNSQVKDGDSDAKQVLASGRTETIVVLASKTTFYQIIQSPQSAGAVHFLNGDANGVLTAQCAYL